MMLSSVIMIDGYFLYCLVLVYHKSLAHGQNKMLIIANVLSKRYEAFCQLNLNQTMCVKLKHVKY